MTNDHPTNARGVYHLTSIARPVDPAYPTNRAVLIVLALGAAVFAALSLGGIINMNPLEAALSALLAGFASWALAREFAPDDNAAAFLALALAWAMVLVSGTASVLLTFVALFLVRIVNRSTGLASRPWDTLLVLGFVLWATVSLGQPLLALVAALAFALDARMDSRLWLSWIASAICLGFSVWRFIVTGYEWQTSLSDWAVPLVIIAANIVVLVRLPSPESPCDVSDTRLVVGRVRAGHAIGTLVALQALLHASPWQLDIIWSVLIAVPVSAVVQGLLGKKLLPISHHPKR